MKIAIRADASPQIGSGHIVRCLTLARKLVQRGARVTFLCRTLTDDLRRTLDAEGIAVAPLPQAPRRTTSGDNDYAAWLDADESDDSKHTVAHVASEAYDWLIVDHYALSNQWEHAVRPHVGALFALDDLGRQHEADVLLDQNFGADAEGRYGTHLPFPSRQFLGPRYALLHERYIAPHAPRQFDDIRRIAVFFGGADLPNMTGRTLEALDHPFFRDVHIDVVVGAANPHTPAITAQAERNTKIHLHHNLPHLADVLTHADLAIGAGGGNTWERCCLGVPTVVVTTAANQEPASQALHKTGVIHLVGRAQDVTTADLVAAVRTLADDSTRRQQMSEQGARLVDGRGADRIAEVIAPTAAKDLVLRPATDADCAFLFHLANDPLVRQQSFSAGPIPWATHRAWFAAKLTAPTVQLYVLEAQGLAVGQIRFDMKSDTAVLSYALDAVARGRKWGRRLVESGLQALAKTWNGTVHASVKHGNAASATVFRDLGFHIADPAPFDHLLFVLEPQRLEKHLGG